MCTGSSVAQTDSTLAATFGKAFASRLELIASSADGVIGYANRRYHER
jgi:hypothetical protein